MKSISPRVILIVVLLLGISGPVAGGQPGVDADGLPAGALDLDGALGFALEHNYAIRQARERIKEERGVELEVRSRAIPQVGMSGSYTGNAREISGYNPASGSSWGISVQARQVVYAGGGVMASVKGARLAREAAVLELEGVINAQLLAVRTQFYAVLLAKEQIGVQEENVQLLGQQLKDARSRFEAGTTSNFEVLRAEVALANGQPPLIQARNDYRLAIEQLRQVLGLSGGTTEQGLELVGRLEVAQAVSYQLAEALVAARAQRPELQQLAKLAAAGAQSVKASRAGYLPEVEVVGGYDWVRSPLSGAWSERREGWTAGVQAQWNIFDGRATAGRVVQARSQLAQAQLALASATLAVEVQVRQAYSSLLEAWELVQASGKTVEQAQEALRLANVRYGAGTATQLDVLTSQVSLTEARLNQLQAGYGYHVALAALRQAIGQADVFSGP
ncbi:MAG: TolC family protein [Opitutaceae bacterium]|nr:TolC family protein [Opitutaceae bacterium]